MECSSPNPGPAAPICERGRWGYALVLLAASGFLFLYRLGDRDLGSSHEARAAQNAQMILSEGDWGLPRLFNQRVELQKPPLYYWLVACIAWLRGVAVDALALRLPAALAALACVWFVYGLGCRCGQARLGFVAALLLATAIHFTWLGRVGRIDMPLTLTVTLALGGFFLGQASHRTGRSGAWRWFLMGYVAIALGLLLKGPIAAVLPFAAAGAWLVAEWRRTRTVPHRELATLAWGLPLILLIAAPWFVWANAQTDNRLWEVFFGYHNIERALHGTLVAHPWWFYGPRLLVDFLPWSVVLPVATWLYVRDPRCRADRLGRFGLCWFATVFIFLSLMKFKRGDYLLPAYPGLVLWLASVFFSGEPRGARALTLAAKRALGGAVALCVAGWLIYIELIEPRYDDGRVFRQFAAEVRRRTDQPVIFFRAEAHEVAFHVGRPLDTILEWENLDWWATRPFPCYIVMPPDCAAVWADHLREGRLERVLDTADLTPHAPRRPLVLLRSGGAPATPLSQVAAPTRGF